MRQRGRRSSQSSTRWTLDTHGGCHRAAETGQAHLKQSHSVAQRTPAQPGQLLRLGCFCDILGFLNVGNFKIISNTPGVAQLVLSFSEDIRGGESAPKAPASYPSLERGTLCRGRDFVQCPSMGLSWTCSVRKTGAAARPGWGSRTDKRLCVLVPPGHTAPA